MRTYTKEEVEILLLKQRENSVLALSLNSSIVPLSKDYFKLRDAILNFPVLHFEAELKLFDGHPNETPKVSTNKCLKEFCECPTPYVIGWSDDGILRCEKCKEEVKQNG